MLFCHFVVSYFAFDDRTFVLIAAVPGNFLGAPCKPGVVNSIPGFSSVSDETMSSF